MADQSNRLQTRREILKTAIGAAGLVVGAPILGRGAVWAQTPAETGNLKLVDDLYIIRMPGEANVIANIDAKGVLLRGDVGFPGTPLPNSSKSTRFYFGFGHIF